MAVNEIWSGSPTADEDKVDPASWKETIQASCPKCRVPLATNAKFCPECGNKVAP